MSCPCMCILPEDGLYSRSMFFYLTSVKKVEGAFVGDKYQTRPTFFGELHKDYLTEQQRFDNISDFFIARIRSNHFNLPPAEFKVAIEDYSFGSKGRVFNIAENTGLLKHKLWKAGYKFEVVAPTTVKKFATGKGNADKEAMYIAFSKDNDVDINKYICPDKKLGSPITDIVDSYYIARYLREQNLARENSRRANTLSQ